MSFSPIFIDFYNQWTGNTKIQVLKKETDRRTKHVKKNRLRYFTTWNKSNRKEREKQDSSLHICTDNNLDLELPPTYCNVFYRQNQVMPENFFLTSLNRFGLNCIKQQLTVTFFYNDVSRTQSKIYYIITYFLQIVTTKFLIQKAIVIYSCQSQPFSLCFIVACFFH